jgi:hypothetical protein
LKERARSGGLSQRGTEVVRFRSVREADVESQVLLGRLARLVSGPSTEAGKAVHRIPHIACGDEMTDDLKLEAVRKRCDVVDGDRGCRRAGEQKAGGHGLAQDMLGPTPLRKMRVRHDAIVPLDGLRPSRAARVRRREPHDGS